MKCRINLKQNFFVKPFITQHENDIDQAWDANIDEYIRASKIFEMPFTYSEYMNFPIKIRKKIFEKMEKIYDQKSKALDKLK